MIGMMIVPSPEPEPDMPTDIAFFLSKYVPYAVNADKVMSPDAQPATTRGIQNHTRT